MSLALTERFSQCRDEGRLALVGYLPLGYPTPVRYAPVLTAAVAAGLDVIEAGLPANEPAHDGATIRAAVRRVRERGLTVRAALALAREAHPGGAPAVAMIYGELLEAVGTGALLAACAEAGMSAVLVPDLPLGEWPRLSSQAREFGLALAGFLPAGAPSTTIREVVGLADGFLYLQSGSGPTGTRYPLATLLPPRLALLQSMNERRLPVVVGFGVQTPADVAVLGELGVDGAVIGTALVQAAAAGPAAVRQLVISLAAAARFPPRRATWS